MNSAKSRRLLEQRVIDMNLLDQTEVFFHAALNGLILEGLDGMRDALRVLLLTLKNQADDDSKKTKARRKKS